MIMIRMNSVEFGWQGDPSTPCKLVYQGEDQTCALRDGDDMRHETK
jgi:hypothetical protein